MSWIIMKFGLLLRRFVLPWHLSFDMLNEIRLCFSWPAWNLIWFLGSFYLFRWIWIESLILSFQLLLLILTIDFVILIMCFFVVWLFSAIQRMICLISLFRWRLHPFFILLISFCLGCLYLINTRIFTIFYFAFFLYCLGVVKRRSLVLRWIMLWVFI